MEYLFKPVKKEMKQFSIWLIVTVVTLTIFGSYFEFVISRECDFGIVVVATLIIPIIAIAYLHYTLKQLTKYLKIKNK